MKKLILTAVLSAVALCVGGCFHVPPGGTKEAGVKFGIPGVFSVNKTISNVKVTSANIAWGDSQTLVQIALFTWESWAKETRLVNPPANPPIK